MDLFAGAVLTVNPIGCSCEKRSNNFLVEYCCHWCDWLLIQKESAVAETSDEEGSELYCLLLLVYFRRFMLWDFVL